MLFQLCAYCGNNWMPKDESKSLPVIKMFNHLLKDTDMIVIKTFIDGSSSLWGTTTFY